jgi:hypothetical protein
MNMKLIKLKDLCLDSPERKFPSWKEFKKMSNQYYFFKALKSCNSNMTKTSKLTKVGRPYLYLQLKRNDLDANLIRKMSLFVEDTEVFSEEEQEEKMLKKAKKESFREEKIEATKEITMKDLVDKGIIKKDFLI